MNPEQREKISAEVGEWLDAFDDPESLPEDFPLGDLDSSPQPDLYSLIAAMTGVAEELRLQGKSFKRLQDELVKRLDHSPTPASTAPQQIGEILEQGREEGRNEVLGEVIELHDRLTHVLEGSQRQLSLTGLFTAWFGQDELQRSMVEGLEMLLSRYQDVLKKHEISQFGQIDQDFDPVCMKAVDAMGTPDLPPGKILGVIHYGYRRRGKVVKYAEVLVSK